MTLYRGATALKRMNIISYVIPAIPPVISRPNARHSAGKPFGEGMDAD